MQRLLNLLEQFFRFFRAIGLAFAPKYYRNDPINFAPLPFSAILLGIHTSLDLSGPNHWTLHCSYKSETRDTQIFLLDPYNLNKPSLVFHHPSGETNHAFAYNFILGSTISKRFNIFLIKAQHHASTSDFLNNTVDSFLHHQQTFAGSVLAVEQIVKYHRKHSKKIIIVTGASMGGIVATLHAYFFGSADFYFPLAAYPNVGEIFLDDSYKYGMAARQAKLKNKAYLESFDIKKPFTKPIAKKILPILGTKDKIVTFAKAKEFWTRSRIKYLAYPYGHFTPAIMRASIQKLILDKLGN